jgi:hypothetical protein
MSPLFQFGTDLNEVIDFSVVDDPEPVPIDHWHVSCVTQVKNRETATAESDSPSSIGLGTGLPIPGRGVGEKYQPLIIWSAMIYISGHLSKSAWRNDLSSISQNAGDATHNFLPLLKINF